MANEYDCGCVMQHGAHTSVAINCPDCGGSGKRETVDGVAAEWNTLRVAWGSTKGYGPGRSGSADLAEWILAHIDATRPAASVDGYGKQLGAPASLIARTERFITRERERRAAMRRNANEEPQPACNVFDERNGAKALAEIRKRLGVGELAPFAEVVQAIEHFVQSASDRTKELGEAHRELLRLRNGAHIPTAADFEALDAHLVATGKQCDGAIDAVERARKTLRQLRADTREVVLAFAAETAVRGMIDATRAGGDEDEDGGLRFDVQDEP